MLLSMFSYLCVILGVLVFTLFIEAKFGVLMLAFLILMPLFSALITLYGRKKIRLSFVLQPMVKKQQKAQLSTRTEKITGIPLPFLRYTILPDAHFSTAPTDVQLALGSKEQIDRRHEITATICGKGKIELIQPRLTGYLGFLNCMLDMQTEAELMILPEIPELSAGNQLFYAISRDSAVSEDENDDTEPAFNGVNTIAGYAHREYQPGDPLKRINWKLSSKKDQLMVRMDESLSIAKTAVMLDFQRPADFSADAEGFSTEQRVTEAALGMLAHCAKQQFACNFYYFAANGWAEVPIDTREQVEALSVSILEHGFGDITERFSSMFSQSSGNGVYLIFTSCPDAALLTLAQTLHGTVHIILPEGIYPAADASIHIWHITDDYRILPVEHMGNGGI